MKTILVVASFHKGERFIREAKAQGWRVILVTGESLKEAAWPTDSIDAMYFMPDPDNQWNMADLVSAVSYLARTVEIDRIAALDDFDVEKGALLREHLRVPGMGDTTARNFRDKLAMRGRAKDAGIRVPAFEALLNDAAIQRYLEANPGPHVLKPRTQANAIGIRKAENAEEAWAHIHALGDARSHYLIERFISGPVYHVDSVSVGGELKFSAASVYGVPPMEVFHAGRVFTSSLIRRDTAEEKALMKVNLDVLQGLNLRYGVSHSEYIRGDDGEFYFLETSARVGGANIAEMVEAATGVNLWQEWARLETAESPDHYQTPASSGGYAGLLNTLARQRNPDMSGFDAPEVAWKMQKDQHAGLIVASKSYDRVQELVGEYTQRFYDEFFMRMPAAENASQLG